MGLARPTIPSYRHITDNRALASIGLFEEDGEGRFALTLAGQMLRSDVPGSMHDMALWITSPPRTSMASLARMWSMRMPELLSRLMRSVGML